MPPSASVPDPDVMTRVLANDLPLQGVILKESHRGYDLLLTAGSTPGHFTCLIRDPAEIRFEQEGGGEHVGLTIRDASGQSTVIRFRAAALPETLNGIAPLEW